MWYMFSHIFNFYDETVILNLGEEKKPHLVVQAIRQVMVVEWGVIVGAQVQPLLQLTAEGGEVGAEGAGRVVLAVLHAQLPAAQRRVLKRVRPLLLQALLVVLC